MSAIRVVTGKKGGRKFVMFLVKYGLDGRLVTGKIFSQKMAFESLAQICGVMDLEGERPSDANVSLCYFALSAVWHIPLLKRGVEQ
jgi:hypothetical protein